jgi:hypothetical protein
MEAESNLLIDEKEKQIFRSYMNTKIDIFQANDGFVMRSSKDHEFRDSYEHRLMQDSSSNILSNSSNLIIFSLSKNSGIANIKHELRKTFLKNIGNKEMDPNIIEKKYEDFHNERMRKKLENDNEFKTLSGFLDHPRFDELMTSNHSFLRYIMNHKYIKYHPRYRELKEKFDKKRCPFFSQNSEENDVEMQEDSDN